MVRHDHRENRPRCPQGTPPPTRDTTRDGRDEPQVAAADAEALLADSISRALLVVLDRLSPAQRVAFVLHDVFAMPFDQIGVILGRSPATAKKLASRARTKIQTQPGETAPQVGQHTRIVTAFLDASRGGDIPALLQLLAPDVVRTVDPILVPTGTATTIHGAPEVAEETRQFTSRARAATVVLIDGKPGIAIAPAGELVALIHLNVGPDRLIHGIRIVADHAEMADSRLTLPSGSQNHTDQECRPHPPTRPTRTSDRC